MTCDEYRVLLDRLLDGEASAEDLEAMARHEAECPDCKALRADLEGLTEDLRGLAEDVPPMPAGLHDGWMRAVREDAAREADAPEEEKEKKPNLTLLRRRRRVRWLGVAAAVLFVLGGTLLTWDELDSAPVSRLLRAGRTPAPAVTAYAPETTPEPAVPEEAVEIFADEAAQALPEADEAEEAAPLFTAESGKQAAADTEAEEAPAIAAGEAEAPAANAAPMPGAARRTAETTSAPTREPEMLMAVAPDAAPAMEEMWEEEPVTADAARIEPEAEADAACEAIIADLDEAAPEEAEAIAEIADEEAEAVPEEAEAAETAAGTDGGAETEKTAWVSLGIGTSRFDDDLAALTALAEAHGGEAADEPRTQGSAAAADRTATLRLRIPADSLEAFLAAAAQTGSVAGTVDRLVPEGAEGPVTVWLTLREMPAPTPAPLREAAEETAGFAARAAEFLRRAGLFLLNALPWLAGAAAVTGVILYARKRKRAKKN